MTVQKDIKEFITEANTLFKEPGAAYTLSEHKGVPYYIPSGSKFLDKLISGKVTGGGYPAGKLIEIFGDPAHGKTTLGIEALKGMQKLGGVSILFDTEASINRERCLALGIDEKELIVVKANTVESVFEKLETLMDLLIEKKKEGLVLWDSIAGTTTNVEDAADYGQMGMSIHARLMSQSLRKIVYQLEKSRVCLIVINQAKANFEDEWNPATLGGEAPRFHASVRLWIRKLGGMSGELLVTDEKGVGSSVGIRSSITTVKNKITSPRRKIVVNIRHKTGIDETLSILEFLKEQGIAKVAGAWTKIELPKKDGTKEEISFYQKDFLSRLETVPGLKEYVEDLIDTYDVIDNVFVSPVVKESV